MAALVAGVLSLLVPTGVVFADPAGPTDYLSEIIAIEPSTPGIAVDVLGGDSFIELTVELGVEATVIGYRGEPYLWFRADGVVLENSLSPTTYLNEERYGTEFPDFADPDAPPEWREVGTSGRWSWHDHRGHLMQPVPPFGTQPGDRILESVVPLVVDGIEVDVTVISTWQPEPSTVPLWVGGAFGLALGAAALVLARRNAPVAAAAMAAGTLSAAAGAWQYLSLPAETGPSITWWLLPVLAVLAAACTLLPFVRRDRVVGGAFVGLAGAVLVVWSWRRLDGLTAAIVPTDAPNWFDRGVTASSLGAGFGIVAAGIVLAAWNGSTASGPVDPTLPENSSSPPGTDQANATTSSA